MFVIYGYRLDTTKEGENALEFYYLESNAAYRVIELQTEEVDSVYNYRYERIVPEDVTKPKDK